MRPVNRIEAWASVKASPPPSRYKSARLQLVLPGTTRQAARRSGNSRQKRRCRRGASMFPGLVVGIEDGQDTERTRGAMPPIQLCIGLIALLAPLSMILPGCQQGEVGADNPNTKLATGNHPPVVRAVTLRPSPLVLTGPIVAQVEAQDVDRHPLSCRH